jgi:hypothetical protein
MKMIAEYLEHALNFERMAVEEKNAEVRAQFERQAAAYRKLVVERAAKYGLPAPGLPLVGAPSGGPSELKSIKTRPLDSH